MHFYRSHTSTNHDFLCLIMTTQRAFRDCLISSQLSYRDSFTPIVPPLVIRMASDH